MKRLLLSLLVLPMTSLATEATLPESIRSVVNVRQVPDAAVSIFAIDLESNEILLDWNGAASRNPGSTVKLVTTLAALDILGPAYTWRTNFFALGNINHGVLNGDLIIQGGGDPFLVAERIWQMLRQLRRAGVEHVRGKLIIDDSYFAVDNVDPGAFDGQPLRSYNVVPNALLMNFKTVRYWFTPAANGRSVTIQPDPDLENLTIRNQLSQKAGPCRGYQRGVAINANDGHDTMTFSGRFPSGCEAYAMDRTALSHNEYVFGLFIFLWDQLGGSLTGGWQNGSTPQDLEALVSFESLPMTDVVTRINKFSNNVMARHLVFTLAAEANGVPGTEAGGIAEINQWLDENNLDDENFVMVNGAGLSRDTRMTTQHLVRLLQYAWGQSYMPEYMSSLALSGLDGTVRRRFDASWLDGKAHLKTGSLDHVSAIAGYLQSRSGRRYAVAIMVNHQDAHRGPGNEIQEAVVRWLYER